MAKRQRAAIPEPAAFAFDFANGVLAFGDTPWFQIWGRRWRYCGEPLTDSALSALQDSVKADLRRIKAGAFRPPVTYVTVVIAYSPESGLSLGGLDPREDLELSGLLALGLATLAARVSPKRICECAVCGAFSLLADLRRRAEPCEFCGLQDPAIRETRTTQTRLRVQKLRAPIRRQAAVELRELVALRKARAAAKRRGQVLSDRARERIEILEQRQKRRRRIVDVGAQRIAKQLADRTNISVQVGLSPDDIRIALLPRAPSERKKK